MFTCYRLIDAVTFSATELIVFDINSFLFHDIVTSHPTNGTLVLTVFLSPASYMDAAVVLVGRSVPRTALAVLDVCIFFFIRVPN